MMNELTTPEPIYIHIQGDSNSQGTLPGIQSQFNMDIGAGKKAEKPWPAVLQTILRQSHSNMIVLNHSEGGRRLIGKSAFESEQNHISQKDGRVALYNIILMMINHGNEKNRNGLLIINLGTNDLQEENLTREQLHGFFIKHIVSILANPFLQYNLLGRIGGVERSTITAFLIELSRLTVRDIELGGSEAKLLDLILKNQDIIRRLFNDIEWRIILIPPVVIAGHPYDSFPSAHLSNQWPTIVNHVIEFFGTPRIIAIQNAQEFATPHIDERGGAVHFDDTDHQVFAQRIAQFFLNDERFRDIFVRTSVNN